MQLKTLLLIVLLAFFFCHSACSQRHQLSQTEAEGKAVKALENYAVKEKIPVDRFKPSLTEKTYFDKEAQVWAVHYESSTDPIHRVNIIVDQFGNTEVHREVSVKDNAEK